MNNDLNNVSEVQIIHLALFGIELEPPSVRQPVIINIATPRQDLYDLDPRCPKLYKVIPDLTFSQIFGFILHSKIIA